MTEMRHRSEYDTGSPVSRHCLFVGNAADAAAAPRPPTLAESRLGTDPILPRFEFQRGALCDFHEALPVCLEATDLGKRGIETTILAALADPRVHPARSCDAFHGIVARYQTNRSVSTHSSVLGDRFGFGEVRRERAGTGTLALAVWIDTGGGGADAIATRFARDLKEFLERAASASCGRRP
jgi:hypothetical protein